MFVGMRGGEPVVQGSDLADAQNHAEAQHQTPHGRKPRNLRLEGVDSLGLSRAQETARLTEQRGGDSGRQTRR